MISKRERLLEVIKILRTHTDEKHQLDIHEIQGHFPPDVKVGVAGIREDLLALEDATIFTVVAEQEKNGMKKRYYYDGRLFQTHDLRLLMDAIVAAKFIPKREVEQLIMKLRSLTSKNLARQLKNELQIADPVHDDIQLITKIVELLHQAIEEKRLLTFKYGKYNTDLQFQFRNNGRDYEVKPLGLVWNRDRYYLIAHFIPGDKIRQYRVDRMREVCLVDAYFVPDSEFNLHKHVEKMVHMYGGEPISFEAEFAEDLINVVIDRFGLQANITKRDDGKFILKTEVAMSDGLVGWLLRWGADVKVLHPPKLVEELKSEIKRLAKLYE